jgi:ubiquitin-like modifier-activating enzyme ATG7
MAERPTAVGWEKNAQGKLGPRVADLAPMMDLTRWVVDFVTIFLFACPMSIVLSMDVTD